MNYYLDLVRESKSTIKYKYSNFPDGHRHINIQLPGIEKEDTISITMRVKKFDDLFILHQATNVFRSMIDKGITIHLYVNYLMAGRYDRKMYDGDSEDLKIVCHYINSLKFDSVTVVEPHSIVTEALLDNFQSWLPMTGMLYNYITGADKSKDFVIFAPDLGAVKRTEQFLLQTHLPLPIGYMHKKRELSTGAIIGMTIVESPPLKGKTVILYDDLCDGGRTFIEASKLVRERGAAEVVLCVTHGIFSKGVDALLEDKDGRIDHIFTSNSYQDLASADRLTVHII